MTPTFPAVVSLPPPPLNMTPVTCSTTSTSHFSFPIQAVQSNRLVLLAWPVGIKAASVARAPSPAGHHVTWADCIALPSSHFHSLSSGQKIPKISRVSAPCPTLPSSSDVNCTLFIQECRTHKDHVSVMLYFWAVAFMWAAGGPYLV